MFCLALERPLNNLCRVLAGFVSFPFFSFSLLLRLNSSPSSGSVSPFTLPQDKCQPSHNQASNNVNVNAHSSYSQSVKGLLRASGLGLWWRLKHVQDTLLPPRVWFVVKKPADILLLLLVKRLPACSRHWGVVCCSPSVGAKWRGHRWDAGKIQLRERATGSSLLRGGNTNGYFSVASFAVSMSGANLSCRLLQPICPPGRIPSLIWTVWWDQVLVV